jgi:Flp pilus assembly protein TadB
MTRGTRVDDTSGHFESAGRGRGIHEFRETPVSRSEVEEVTREEMAAHSPDGRVPDRESRGRGRTALWTLLAVGLPLVLATIIYIGGVAALLMGMVYVLVLLAVAFPVWYSGIMRKREEDEATEMVRHTLSDQKDKEQAA